MSTEIQSSGEKTPLLSAYTGNLAWRIILGLVIFFSMYGMTNYSWTMGKNSVAPEYTQFLPLPQAPTLLLCGVIFILYIVLYIYKIRKTKISFLSNNTLTIESGFIGSTVINYDLQFLQKAELRQSLFDKLSNDGTLILQIAVRPANPRQQFATEKILFLKGLAKWDVLKDYNEELNNFINKSH